MSRNHEQGLTLDEPQGSFYDLFGKKNRTVTPTSTASESVAPRRDREDGLHPYAAAAIGRELARLDSLARPWREGANWDITTFEVACNLIELANSPWSGYTLQRAAADFQAHAPADEAWGTREHEQKWMSAANTVGNNGRPEPEKHFSPVSPVATLPTIEPGEDFWHSRPHLATIHQYARARRVGPWAVLGTVLARVIAATSPSVQLPPLVGGYGSLNIFAAIVAPSGGGKGTAQTAGTDVLNINGGEQFPEINLGSGEGIVHAYVRREQLEKGKPTEVVQHRQSVLFNVAEIDTFAAIARRQGSTLAGEIRKVWSGEALGFHNADETRRLNLEAHTYRAALIVGVQPGRGAALLDDADGGTPQRFIWLPALDPSAPDTPPPLPDPITWTPPKVEHTFGRQVLDVAEEVSSIIDENRVRTLRGATNVLDGHALFTQLKIATGFALLDGRTKVTTDDWHLAQSVMARSDQTRAEIQDFLAHSKAQRNAEQAQARGHASAIAAETASERFIEQAKTAIRKTLEKHPEGAAASVIRRAARAGIRDHLEAALSELEDAGEIVSEEIEYQGQKGVRYVLTTR